MGFGRENDARRKISAFLKTYVEQTHSLPLDVIDAQIDKALDDFDLGISNFYRLRRYFIDRNLPYISKEDVIRAYSRSVESTHKKKRRV